MEKYTMFLDWKNQHCENDYTIQSNLQIQCNLCQITNDIFHRTRKKILKFVWRHKRLQIMKPILRKKNGARESDSLASNYTTKLQSSEQYGIQVPYRFDYCSFVV